MKPNEPVKDNAEFSSLVEAITAAMYVEQILAAENMLIEFPVVEHPIWIVGVVRFGHGVGYSVSRIGRLSAPAILERLPAARSSPFT